MCRLAFDIESTAIPQDGRLVHEVDRVHCIVAIDMDTDEVHKFGPTEIRKGVKLLNRAKQLVAHNGIKFDLAVLQHKYPEFTPKYPVFIDTLVISRLFFPNLMDIDFGKARQRENYALPKRLYGSHGLEAWGYRLGMHKGDYSKALKEQGWTDEEIWGTYSQGMLDYCVQDVRVTVKLFNMFKGMPYSPKAIKLEHQCAELIAKQERNGFTFDGDKANALTQTLLIEKLEIENRLKDQFGCWYVSTGVFTPKNKAGAWIENDDGSYHFESKKKLKDKLKAHTLKGVPYNKVKLVEFNPSSRQHIAKVLQEMGWVPEVFSENGQPKVDETTLSAIDFPEAGDLIIYLMLVKRLGQLSEGKQAWLKALKNDGRIHGAVNTNGAVTGRATHSQPNVAQVPSGSAPYGPECRELFTVPDGWVLLGTDASGLELRCLAHFMAEWDGGHYGDIILNGDIHTENQKAAGLPTRNNAKTFIYAFLYGAGDEKIGSIVGGSSAVGRKLKSKFLRGVPALKYLQDAIKNAIKKDGHLIGIDGRKLHVRSTHSALNTLLQSAGGLICKHWGVIIEEKLQALGLKHGWDGDYAFNAWIHDEYQIACKTTEIAEVVGKVAREAIQEVEKIYNWKCPLDADFAIGANWKETH